MSATKPPKLSRCDAVEMGEAVGALKAAVSQMRDAAHLMRIVSVMVEGDEIKQHADELLGAAKTADEWSREMMRRAKR